MFKLQMLNCWNFASCRTKDESKCWHAYCWRAGIAILEVEDTLMTTMLILGIRFPSWIHECWLLKIWKRLSSKFSCEFREFKLLWTGNGPTCTPVPTGRAQHWGVPLWYQSNTAKVRPCRRRLVNRVAKVGKSDLQECTKAFGVRPLAQSCQTAVQLCKNWISQKVGETRSPAFVSNEAGSRGSYV